MLLWQAEVKVKVIRGSPVSLSVRYEEIDPHLGSFVINSQVMGELAVSRAFGNAELKKVIQKQHIAASTALWSSPCPLFLLNFPLRQSIVDKEGVAVATSPSGSKEPEDMISS